MDRRTGHSPHMEHLTVASPPAVQIRFSLPEKAGDCAAFLLTTTRHGPWWNFMRNSMITLDRWDYPHLRQQLFDGHGFALNLACQDSSGSTFLVREPCARTLLRRSYCANRVARTKFSPFIPSTSSHSAPKSSLRSKLRQSAMQSR